MRYCSRMSKRHPLCFQHGDSCDLALFMQCSAPYITTLPFYTIKSPLHLILYRSSTIKTEDLFISVHEMLSRSDNLIGQWVGLTRVFACFFFVFSYIWFPVVLFFFSGRIPHPSLVLPFYQYIPLSFPIKKKKKMLSRL